MSQAGPITGGGSGPSGPDLHLTSFIVDPTLASGSNYATIQEGIDAAVTAGASILEPLLVYIRQGAYTEDLVIPGGVKLVGEWSPLGSNFYIPTITGIHTLDGAAGILFCQNLSFISTATAGEELFAQAGGAAWSFFFTNCVLDNDESPGVGPICNNTGSFTSVLKECFILAGSGAIPLFIGSAGYSFQNCDFSADAVDTITSDSGLSFEFCENVPLCTSGLSIDLTNCMVLGDLVCPGVVSINDCGIGTTPSASGTVVYSGSVYSTQGSGLPLWSPTTDKQLEATLAGNLIFARRVDDDYQIERADYYIGVTDTSAARTITLPLTPILDQMFIIKDESGLAGTNPITIDTPGAELIDGAATYPINANYGSVTVNFDGTNYFVMNAYL